MGALPPSPQAAIPPGYLEPEEIRGGGGAVVSA
jgi:hypothetical protein